MSKHTVPEARVPKTLRIGVLASHAGSLFQVLADASKRGDLNAEIAVLISNNSRCGAIRRAGALNIPTCHLSGKTHPDPDQLDAAILNTLMRYEIDFIVLAGYMKQLGPQVLTYFMDRIINTHPALLPLHGGQGMYGRRVHQAVLDSGAAESGVTIHRVVADYDTGPILAQSRVPVLPNDRVEDLELRVKEAERALLLETVAECLLKLSEEKTRSS